MARTKLTPEQQAARKGIQVGLNPWTVTVTFVDSAGEYKHTGTFGTIVQVQQYLLKEETANAELQTETYVSTIKSVKIFGNAEVNTLQFA